MSAGKPKLVITPEVIDERGSCMIEHANSLKQLFDVHTVEGKKSVPREEFLNNIQNAFAILCSPSQPINEEVVKAAGPTLKVVSQPTAGFDNIDLDAMKKYSVRVGRAGKAVTAAAAEQAVTILLAASRLCVTFANAYRSNPTKYYQPKCPTADGLQNSNVGIVGAGQVGSSIARKLAQFDLKKLIYWDQYEVTAMKSLNAEKTSLEYLFASCDYIIVSLDQNKDTAKLVNMKLFNLMKPNALIVNIGRGGLINTDDLVEALQKKKLGGAALDVTDPEPLPPDHPLLKMDNVLITPHVGGLTNTANEVATKMAVQNIIAVFKNEPMADEVKL